MHPDQTSSARPGLNKALAALLVLMVGLADWLTGPDISLSIFYLIPVMVLAPIGKRWERLALSVLCGVTWLACELVSHARYSLEWVPYWNALVRAGIFIIVGELTAQLADRNVALEREVAERTGAQARLGELNLALEEKVAERSAAAEARAQDLSRSEEALRKQTEILRSILNNMGDGIIVVDVNGNIGLSNPEAKRLLEVDGEGSFGEWVVNQRVLQPGTSVWTEQDEPLLLSAARGEIIDNREMLLARKDDPEGVWVRTTSRPVLDAAGRLTGAVMVFHDITARKTLERQLAQISDREQRRIGQDLHDGVCQNLVSTSFACNLLAETLAEKGVPEAGKVMEISDLIRDAVIEARNLARVLYPVQLTTEGLGPALEDLAQTMRTLTTIPCRFASDTPVMLRDDLAATNLFRIAQEAVNNAIKHSRATEVNIELAEAEDCVTLRVADNGVGIDSRTNRRSGMGLHIMRSRASAIGATFEMRSGPAGGTIVSCSLRNPAATT